MSRKLLTEDKIDSAIASQVGGAAEYQSTITEIEAALSEDVVVVAMAHNPYCKKALKLLADNSIAHKELSYGGYMSEWKRRGAIKMWAGWQTFPMVFIKGVLIGGFEDLEKLHNSGDLGKRLA